ncbi:hypothetical protein Patl1_28706 [Pistacia atlantica]|uniref:Uncharacterized protein n=1 Tax=Pistacia atlantica TaxID=434234 RepID=A0ACC1BDT4_9ROSI|nr:hypothetical protein Patl1_28706 [Pistacia atlantica]
MVLQIIVLHMELNPVNHFGGDHIVLIQYENEPRSMDIVEGAVKNAAGRETIDLRSGGRQGNQLS